MKKLIGVKDRNGIEIAEGDWVSLDGNITADDSLGFLPNGWTFGEADVYEVVWDDRIKDKWGDKKWSLDLGCAPDTAYDTKYMNHAVGLLHSGDVTIVPKPEDAQKDTDTSAA